MRVEPRIAYLLTLLLIGIGLNFTYLPTQTTESASQEAYPAQCSYFFSIDNAATQSPATLSRKDDYAFHLFFLGKELSSKDDIKSRKGLKAISTPYFFYKHSFKTINELVFSSNTSAYDNRLRLAYFSRLNI